MIPLSARNPRVAQLRQLSRQRRARDQVSMFVLEGPMLLAEALQAGIVPIDVMLAGPPSQPDLPEETFALLEELNVPVWEVESRAFLSAVPATTPQPVVATVPYLDKQLDEVLGPDVSFVVVGVDIKDPGNAGTIIRTAAAAGADAVVFAGNSVDCYNPKVVRSTAGALVRVPLVRSVDADTLWPALNNAGLQTVGLAGGGTATFDETNLTQPVAVVLGNESRGLDPEHQALLDHVVHIPMANNVESLNVAAAAAVVCFEVQRQRR